MADIEVKKEDGLQEPSVGDKSEHTTTKTPIKEDNLTDREKDIVKEKKVPDGLMKIQLGNTDVIQIKFLESILRDTCIAILCGSNFDSLPLCSFGCSFRRLTTSEHGRPLHKSNSGSRGGSYWGNSPPLKHS